MSYNIHAQFWKTQPAGSRGCSERKKMADEGDTEHGDDVMRDKAVTSQAQQIRTGRGMYSTHYVRRSGTSCYVSASLNHDLINSVPLDGPGITQFCSICPTRLCVLDYFHTPHQETGRLAQGKGRRPLKMTPVKSIGEVCDCSLIRPL
jgi:hypothetical protein